MSGSLVILHQSDEIRRWRLSRRLPPVQPVFAAPHRIAIDDHEVLVVRRRPARLGDRALRSTTDAR